MKKTLLIIALALGLSSPTFARTSQQASQVQNTAQSIASASGTYTTTGTYAYQTSVIPNVANNNGFSQSGTLGYGNSSSYSYVQGTISLIGGQQCNTNDYKGTLTSISNGNAFATGPASFSLTSGSELTLLKGNTNDAGFNAAAGSLNGLSYVNGTSVGTITIH